MPRLKPSDFNAVRDAVRKFENKTRGELVPLVIPDAGEYSSVRYQAGIYGFLIALLAGEGVSYLQGWPLDAREITTILVFGVLVGTMFGMVPVVARLVLGRKRIAKIVHRRALAEFTRLGCGNTRENIGILVMVALFERRIEIIADRGIHTAVVEKGESEAWGVVTAGFAHSAGQGRAVEGLIAAIEAIGEILSRHFPSDGKSTNELSDELRTEGADD